MVFLCKGLRPLHPRGLNPAALIDPAMQDIRRGGWFSSSPDAPATLGDADSNQCYATFDQ